jgi:hypothetical protein
MAAQAQQYPQQTAQRSHFQLIITAKNMGIVSCKAVHKHGNILAVKRTSMPEKYTCDRFEVAPWLWHWWALEDAPWLCA